LHPVADRFRALQRILTSHPRNFTLLLFSFLLTSLACSDTKLLAQYISKRYNWTFASAGYLLSAKAVVNFTLLTCVVPRILHALRRSAQRGTQARSSDEANVYYAKICLVLSVLGALAIALAATIWLLFPSLILYALGSALPIFTLSLLKSPSVCPTQEGRQGDPSGPETHVFSIVMLVKTLGSLLGAPLMTVAWVQGITLGSVAFGLPYLVSAACYLAAILIFSGIRVGP
jgi:hypothetical protein